MSDVNPFCGVRYDVSRVGALAEVVAPPYDVIDPSLQDRLYQRSPYNVIRLELNREEPTDSESQNRYTRAAGFLKDWLRHGILRQDDHPALYVYQQTFEIEGVTHIRKGFFARVRLEPFGKGTIYPHERTLAGPKADRLALYRATGFAVSPIFGLYPDPEGDVLRTLESGLRDRTPLVAQDHLEIDNRLWVVDDSQTHSAVRRLMAERPVFIADGHHRYETGLKFRDERAASPEYCGPDDPSNFCLMMLVGVSDPGLLILPTHRLVSGFAGLTAGQLAERLQGEFEVRMTGQHEAGCRAAWETVEHGDGQDLLGFGTRADGHWVTARLRSDLAMDRLAPEHSPDWRSLGVSVLHVLVLDSLLRPLGTPSCRYVHTIGEVVGAVATGSCDLACLVPPAKMEHVESIASGLETMPPKSTYFYPKLLTGLVLNPLVRATQ
jgi:uncharacterized protein (DUF1015 family)